MMLRYIFDRRLFYMSLLILFIFILATLFLVILHYHRTAITILCVSIVYIIAIGNGFIPCILGKQLLSPSYYTVLPEWKKNNGIILLGGGTAKLGAIPKLNPLPLIASYSRIQKTAQLYYSCKKSSENCKIIVSGGDPCRIGSTEAVVYRDELIALGVNPNDIELETKSLNTFQNAKYVEALLKSQEIQFEQLYLVTSGFHLKRALLYFSYFKIMPMGVASDFLASKPGFIPTSYNFLVTDMMLHEILGIWRFHLYNFLGWNITAKVPGSL